MLLEVFGQPVLLVLCHIPPHIDLLLTDFELYPNGHAQGMEGVLGYCHVDDIEKSLDQLVGANEAGRRI